MVTIGLPFCNNRSTLQRAIQSVFAQTIRDWQLILLDDGSQDGSCAIAQSVRDARVHFVTGRSNRGLAARLNQIADRADGEFLARMDADDLMHPERLERQLTVLQNRAAVELVDSGLLSIDEWDRPVGKRCCEPLDVSPRGIIAGKVPVHAAVLARTEWFRANRYDVRYARAQDLELWCRTLRANRLLVQRLTEPLYFARESGTVSLAKMQTTYAVQQEIVRRHGPHLVGVARTHLRLGALAVRTLAYQSADFCGLRANLVARRNSPLTPAEYETMSRVIDHVRQTRVPGLEWIPEAETATSL